MRSGRYVKPLAVRKSDESKQNKRQFQRFKESLKRKLKRLLKIDLDFEQFADRSELEGKEMVSHKMIDQ